MRSLEGFYSTKTVLLKLTDNIRVAKDKKYVTVLLQFDFSKAFDNISPSRLLTKLKNMGVSKSTLSWIHSYPTNRSQCVISQSTSDFQDTNLGLPQGSVMGSLLFSYTPTTCTFTCVNLMHPIFYPDDLKIYVKIPLDRALEEITSLSAAA